MSSDYRSGDKEGSTIFTRVHYFQIYDPCSFLNGRQLLIEHNRIRVFTWGWDIFGDICATVSTFRTAIGPLAKNVKRSIGQTPMGEFGELSSISNNWSSKVQKRQYPHGEVLSLGGFQHGSVAVDYKFQNIIERKKKAQGGGRITFLRPLSWGTAVHCGRRWPAQRPCWERNHGTPWLVGWTVPPDIGRSRSDCAPLKEQGEHMTKLTEISTSISFNQFMLGPRLLGCMHTSSFVVNIPLLIKYILFHKLYYF